MRHLVIVLGFAVAACASEGVAPSTAPLTAEQGAPDLGAPTLSLVWRTQGFSNPEGVAAVPGGGWFISNVAGDGDGKDGRGWITRLSPDGAIADAQWAHGFDAPKGMAVYDGALYVSDIDRVHVIDLDDPAVRRSIAIPGARFLNDVTVWNGEVFVADSGDARIYVLRADGAETWLADERLEGVNGLLGDDERLLVTTMDGGELLAASQDGALTALGGGMENADGVGRVLGGGWLVSSWPGQIFYISPAGDTTELADTREAGIYQNDLTVFGDMVITPNWEPGTVTAQRIER